MAPADGDVEAEPEDPEPEPDGEAEAESVGETVAEADSVLASVGEVLSEAWESPAEAQPVRSSPALSTAAASTGPPRLTRTSAECPGVAVTCSEAATPCCGCRWCEVRWGCCMRYLSVDRRRG